MSPRLPPLFDLLLPTACAVCALPGTPLCAGCRNRVRPLEPPLCAGCGAPVAAAVPRCGECRPPAVRSRQAVLYEGVAAVLVAALKDRRRRDLAPALARMIADHLEPPPPGTALVPVPGRPAGVRERGFDHAERIAAALGRTWDRPVARTLARRADAPAQRGAPRDARVAQVRGRFGLSGDELPQTAMLVDDVRTTGATLSECARVLLSAGVTPAGAVCVARAVRPRRGAPAGARNSDSIRAD